MPDRQCLGCTKQVQWGCEARRIGFPAPGEADDPDKHWTKPAHLPVQILGETSYACPRQHIRENPVFWGHLLRYYGLFQKGFLPSAGGVADQANKAMELFQIVEQANMDCDRAEAEKRQRQSARGGPPQARKR